MRSVFGIGEKAATYFLDVHGIDCVQTLVEFLGQENALELMADLPLSNGANRELAVYNIHKSAHEVLEKELERLEGVAKEYDILMKVKEKERELQKAKDQKEIDEFLKKNESRFKIKTEQEIER